MKLLINKLNGARSMTTKKSSQIILAFITILFLGCKYQYGDLNKNGQNGDNNGFVDPDSIISYELIQKTTLRSCANCHSGNKQPDIVDFTSTKANINKIINQVLKIKAMPPQSNGYAALSQCELKVFEKWVQMGTPDNSLEKVSSLTECINQKPPVPVLPIELMPLSYDTLVTHFLQKKCLTCHNPESDNWEAKEYLFYPYSEIDNNIKWWSGPGANAKIIRKINGSSDEPMPPLDSKIPAATPQEIDFIIRWIDAGRPE